MSETHGAWRCDTVPKGGFQVTTTWHTTEAAAKVAEWAAYIRGAHSVAWFDAAVYA